MTWTKYLPSLDLRLYIHKVKMIIMLISLFVVRIDVLLIKYIAQYLIL